MKIKTGHGKRESKDLHPNVLHGASRAKRSGVAPDGSGECGSVGCGTARGGRGSCGRVGCGTAPGPAESTAFAGATGGGPCSRVGFGAACGSGGIVAWGPLIGEPVAVGGGPGCGITGIVAPSDTVDGTGGPAPWGGG